MTKKEEYPGEIADAHMHLWDRVNGYSWLDETIFKGRLEGNFIIKDYLRAINGHKITKAVHVEAHGFVQDPVLETKWVQEIADKWGIPQGIVGYAPLHRPEVETLLKRHCAYSNMRGIRMNLRYGPKGFFVTDRNYLLDKEWQKGFALLEKYGLSFDMQIYPSQVSDAIELMKSYKNITVVLDHLALPNDPSEKTFDHWSENMQKCAELPNVYIKLSGIGEFFRGLDKLSLIDKYIAEAINVFGVRRSLFASNCPPDTAFIPLDSLMGIFKKAASKYTEKECRLLFYQNTCDVYRI